LRLDRGCYHDYQSQIGHDQTMLGENRGHDCLAVRFAGAGSSVGGSQQKARGRGALEALCGQGLQERHCCEDTPGLPRRIERHRNVAAASLGGFGDVDAEEEADVEQPVDFVALGEQQPVQVLDEEDAKQEDVEEQKQEEEEQLPEVLATHFASRATRSGRVPKKKKVHDAG